MKTCAWIFLCVGEQPTPVRDIIEAADAINRIIPRKEELQTSLGWLWAQGMVREDDKKYLLTPTGAGLKNSVWQGDIFMTQHRIAEEFRRLPVVEFPRENISEVEYRIGCEP